MKNLNIKEWYSKAYPSDDMVMDIKGDVTFEGLLDTLDRCEDVYDYVGAYDSVVRERTFEKLAEVLNVDYNHIYSMWLKDVK